MFPNARFIKTNGIRMALYEQGTGPAVIFVHGFPELGFSWRHQLPALADAGFRAIAPDMRGYGQTDAPGDPAAYCLTELVADLEGLLDSLGLDDAIFVGHDWGALLLWQMATLVPHRIKRLVALNIPHLPRTPTDPIALMRARFGDDFYIVDFQDSNEADAEFAADPAHFFTMMMRKNQLSRDQFNRLPPDKKVISLRKLMERSEPTGDAVLTDKELDYYVNAFSNSGFTGPINWYRNWTRNWELTAGVNQHIDIPTLFIGAADDIVITTEQIEGMKALVSDLTIEMLAPCGHWTQQERPDDVNRLLLEWLHR